MSPTIRSRPPPTASPMSRGNEVVGPDYAARCGLVTSCGSTNIARRERNGKEGIVMTKRPMNEGQWVGMPESTEERIEEEVVSLILGIVEWKKRNDRPGAKWKVGTTTDAEKRLRKLRNPQIPISFSSWKRGSPKRAAKEISEYHGMEMEGIPDEEDTYIYAYTDRLPSRHERKQREKEPTYRKTKANIPSNKGVCRK